MTKQHGNQQLNEKCWKGVNKQVVVNSSLSQQSEISIDSIAAAIVT